MSEYAVLIYFKDQIMRRGPFHVQIRLLQAEKEQRASAPDWEEGLQWADGIGADKGKKDSGLLGEELDDVAQRWKLSRERPLCLSTRMSSVTFQFQTKWRPLKDSEYK